MLEIALIGYGAIAGYVAEKLKPHSDVTITDAICKPGRQAAAGELYGPDIRLCTSAGEISGDVRLAVDCAGHPGLREHAPALLRRGIDVISVSSGALADADTAAALDAAARAGNARLQIASGSVGAIDTLAAAALGDLAEVTYTGRKPPGGWKGSAAEEILDLDALTREAVHFEGPAREAALRYPKNANVAATVALAGLGLDATNVRLIADPGVTRNCHEVHAQGAFGTLSFRVEANPFPENPRSSALAAMSAARAVLNRVDPVFV